MKTVKLIKRPKEELILEKIFKKSLLITLIGLIGVGFFAQRYGSNKSLCVPIHYNESGIPVVDAVFGDCSCSLKINLGYQIPLVLNENTLKQIKKKPSGMTKWISVEGEAKSAPAFIIPKVELGPLTIKDLIVTTSPNSSEFLGQYVGGKQNFLLDLRDSRLIVSVSLSELKKFSIACDDWVKIPFEISERGPIIRVDTDIGERKVLISTTQLNNFMKTELIPSEKSFFSSLGINGSKFDSIFFYEDTFPVGMVEVDGVLGINFLKLHAVYFDSVHKTAYIENRKPYFEKIPVTFTKQLIPEITVELDNKKHILELDFGLEFPLSLKQDLFEGLEKNHYGKASWLDFNGNLYQSELAVIPHMKIGGLLFFDLFTKQENPEFLINTSSDGSSIEEGSIGRPLVEKYNLLFDFPNSMIYASDNLKQLQEKNLISKNLLKVPFVNNNNGIIINVQTDQGSCQLIMDTGSTYVVMRSSHPDFTKQFLLSGYNFGVQKILQLPIDNSFECDGFLGMNFLIKHRFYIDYQNRTIFFDLEE